MKEFTIVSINDNLFNEFSIEELEERLETDPFLLSSLFNLGHPSNAESEVMGCSCKNLNSCPQLACVCDGPGTNDSGCSGLSICSPVCELGVG